MMNKPPNENKRTESFSKPFDMQKKARPKQTKTPKGLYIRKNCKTIKKTNEINFPNEDKENSISTRWLTNFRQQLSLVSCIFISIVKSFFWSLCSNRCSSRLSSELAIPMMFWRDELNRLWITIYIHIEVELIQCQCNVCVFVMSNSPCDRDAGQML